ncbi:unnamed protein product [Ambrosiozyma monospora]|uniref:Unnamed protein product n=1 Tax=Ambrosiozyma monospora TaxID=43982 RepID=A0ACB5SSY8_AMBMO|nr:unnamed protein product [Ambrosiozyma monospora]
MLFPRQSPSTSFLLTPVLDLTGTALMLLPGTATPPPEVYSSESEIDDEKIRLTSTPVTGNGVNGRELDDGDDSNSVESSASFIDKIKEFCKEKQKKANKVVRFTDLSDQTIADTKRISHEDFSEYKVNPSKSQSLPAEESKSIELIDEDFHSITKNSIKKICLDAFPPLLDTLKDKTKASGEPKYRDRVPKKTHENKKRKKAIPGNRYHIYLKAKITKPVGKMEFMKHRAFFQKIKLERKPGPGDLI